MASSVTHIQTSITRSCATDAHGRVLLEDLVSAINFSLPEWPTPRVSTKELLSSIEFSEIVSSVAAEAKNKRIPVITVQRYAGKYGTYITAEVAAEIAIRYGCLVEKSIP
jgi:hypothetical protein